MHLLVFPLSSLIVIGLSSLIRANATGQSNLYLRRKSSTDLNSCSTNLNAALYCVNKLEHDAVYLQII